MAVQGSGEKPSPPNPSHQYTLPPTLSMPSGGQISSRLEIEIHKQGELISALSSQQEANRNALNDALDTSIKALSMAEDASSSAAKACSIATEAKIRLENELSPAILQNAKGIHWLMQENKVMSDRINALEQTISMGTEARTAESRMRAEAARFPRTIRLYRTAAAIEDGRLPPFSIDSDPTTLAEEIQKFLSASSGIDTINSSVQQDLRKGIALEKVFIDTDDSVKLVCSSIKHKVNIKRMLNSHSTYLDSNMLKVQHGIGASDDTPADRGYRNNVKQLQQLLGPLIGKDKEFNFFYINPAVYKVAGRAVFVPTVLIRMYNDMSIYLHPHPHRSGSPQFSNEGRKIRHLLPFDIQPNGEIFLKNERVLFCLNEAMNSIYPSSTPHPETTPFVPQPGLPITPQPTLPPPLPHSPASPNPPITNGAAETIPTPTLPLHEGKKSYPPPRPSPPSPSPP